MNNECINLFEEFSHFYCKMKLNSGETSINSFAPGDFPKKHILKLAKWCFWSLSCYKELKHTIKPFSGRTLERPSDPDAKY